MMKPEDIDRARGLVKRVADCDVFLAAEPYEITVEFKAAGRHHSDPVFMQPLLGTMSAMWRAYYIDLREQLVAEAAQIGLEIPPFQPKTEGA